MKQIQPSLQTAVITGLNILNDPEVRIPVNQAEGVAALRMLLSAIASGQLVVGEPATTPVGPTEAAPVERRPQISRKSKLNGHAVGPAADSAAPPAAQ